MAATGEDSIYEAVLRFIEAPLEARFEELALRVFRHQFSAVPSYRDYCISRGVAPSHLDRIRSLDQVPPISTVAFKYADLCDRAAIHDAKDSRNFLTSGTTIGPGERGRHLVPRPEIYRSSAIRHLARMLFPDRLKMPILSLHPTADRMPESSLGQMISWCIEEFGTPESICVADRRSVDINAAMEFLHRSQLSNQQACLLGTTASFAALYDALNTARTPLRLPARSRLMDTGGAKGQAVPLSLDEMLRAAETLLGIPASMVINEYGMTEMCSQLYDATPFNSDYPESPGVRRKIPPPWLRVDAVDPSSLEGLPNGATGLIRVFDLANVGSVSALLTGDLGVVEAGAVEVLGRAEAGDLRGCALGIEEFAVRGR